MNIDYNAIGQRIKKARVKIGITQEVLAEKADLSAPHVSNVETGNTKLSLPTLIKIANVLSVSVDELLSDNIVKSKIIFENDAYEILSDCNEFEIRILVDIIKASKTAIRKASFFKSSL